MQKNAVLLMFLILFGACTTPPIAQPSKEPKPLKQVGTPIEITLTGIGSSKFSARVRPKSLETDVTNQINLGEALIRSSTDIVPLGQPRTSGYRYLHVTLPISTSQGVFTNLTFMAMNDPDNGALTAVSGLSRYPGLPAYTRSEFDALAEGILPTSPIMLEPKSQGPALVPGEEDALQIYLESEVSSFPNVLPFGFVAHDGDSRLIDSAGTITIAMKVPLQALAKDDPYTIQLRFGIFEETNTFITESLEAQLPINQAAFQAARVRLGGDLRVMPGTNQKEKFVPFGRSATSRAFPNPDPSLLAICQVRTVGTAAAPTSYLVNRLPTSVQLRTRVITVGQTLPLETSISDANGAFYLPAQISLNSPGLGCVKNQHLTACHAGITTVNTNVCGVTAVSDLNLLSNVVPIAAGFDHSAAMTSDDTVVAWGSNTSGQINVPNHLTGVLAVAASSSRHTLALKQDGTVVAWGSNANGQSAIPNALDNVVAVETGTFHSLALKSNGTVVAWGNNNFFQSNVPNDLSNVAAITGGYGHSLALKSDATLVAWGLLNQYGQTDIPSGLNDVIAIASGTYHNLALKQNGTIVAWGWNGSGQSTVPTNLTDVIAIGAGSQHSIALKSNGTVVAWGQDDVGQSTVPTGLTDVVAIAAGGSHNLALKSDGSLVAWGDNASGQSTIPDISPLTFKIP